jgi:hypothetical protein
MPDLHHEGNPMRSKQTAPDIRKGWPYRWQEPRTVFERRDGSGHWPWWIEHIDHQRIGGGKGSGSGSRPTVIFRAQPYLPLHGVRRDLGYLKSLGWRVAVSKKRSTYAPGRTVLIEMVAPHPKPQRLVNGRPVTAFQGRVLDVVMRSSGPLAIREITLGVYGETRRSSHFAHTLKALASLMGVGAVVRLELRRDNRVVTAWTITGRPVFDGELHRGVPMTRGVPTHSVAGIHYKSASAFGESE